MSAAHSATTTLTIQNPGRHSVAATTRGVLLAFVVIGVLTFGAGLATDAKAVWPAFLHNHFYFLSLALGGLFFASTQWITNAMWSAPIRRISESFTAYLPVALVAFVILAFGIHDLYEWSHPEHVKGDIILEGKASYLNVTFFIVRNVVAMGLWIFFAVKMVGNSVAQDGSRDFRFTLKNRTLSALFLMVFALTYTMASFDQLMSLDPHWFSTMFGVYMFSGLFYSVLALTAILAVYFKESGKVGPIINENHLHDLGKFMFAFTIFYAYIGFSQYMLIWYANMPEETGYFLRRLHGGWSYVTLFLLVGKFMVPFFLLMPRGAKRNGKHLAGVGCFMLVAHWIDLMWVVQPEIYSEGPRVGWIEIGMALGFTGLFGLAVSRFFAKNNIVAIGDPRLEESVFHHHQ